MPWGSKWRSAWRTFVHGSRLDGELDDELLAYLDGLIERRVQRGEDPVAARRAALLEMGGLEPVKEAVRDGRVGRHFETLSRDVRYAWRGLCKAPGFTLAAIATFALGIGAAVAVFSAVRAVLLAPLPYRDSSRLVFVWSDMTTAGYPRAPLSGPELNDLRAGGSLFAGFGAIWTNTAALTGDGEPEQLRIGIVTSDFFSVLGADAALGRTFRSDDEAPAAPARILLGAAVWRRRFGGDPTIVGRRILVNSRPVTVIEVMPATFRLLLPPDAAVPDDLQAWVPFGRGLVDGPRGQQFLRVIGRLRPGVSFEAAEEQVAGIARQISARYVEYGQAGRVFRPVRLQADDVREIKPVLLGLFGGVAILLLIACVNVAGLLVARAASRRHETRLRVALGAGHGRLVQQLLVEGLVLAGIGVLVGLGIGYGGLKLLLAFRPDALARLSAARIDRVVLAFACGISFVCGILFSLTPMRDVVRPDVASTSLRGDRMTSGHVDRRIRSGLVIVQIALSVVLLVAAALLARTFVQLLRADLGFRADSLLSFRIALPGSRYGPADTANAFGRRLQSELLRVPGAQAVGAISHLPYDDLPNWGGPYTATRGADPSTLAEADYRAVTPDTLAALGARLLDGRFFAESDDRGSAPVVIVDDLLAQKAWPGRRAVGQALSLDPGSSGHPTTWVTVVGVVRHLRLRSLVEPLSEQVYFPERQVLRNPMAYVVKAGTDPSNIAGAVRDAVAQLDPALPIYDVRPVTAYVDAARGAQRFTMALAATFASVAGVLACVGIYGLVAYSVVLRRREFGVRLALGARPSHLVRSVVGEGAVVALVGLALGGAAAVSFAQFIRAQLFGVPPDDLVTYATVIPLLGVAVVFACWIPARRAARNNPLEALRTE